MLIDLLFAVACLSNPQVSPLQLGAISVLRTEPAGGRQPEVKATLETLRGHVYRRGKQDKAALELMAGLRKRFGKSTPKERKAIARAFGKCLAHSRKDLAKGKPDNQLHLTAAKGLGVMGEVATPILIKWIDHKTHRYNDKVRRELILSLGRTKDPKAVEPLIGLLDYKENKTIAWAAVALRSFHAAPSDIRKRTFNGVLKQLATAKNTRGGFVGRARWKVVAKPMKKTLVILSDTKGMAVEKWQGWWNKNKRKEWGKARG